MDMDPSKKEGRVMEHYHMMANVIAFLVLCLPLIGLIFWYSHLFKKEEELAVIEWIGISGVPPLYEGPMKYSEAMKRANDIFNNDLSPRLGTPLVWIAGSEKFKKAVQILKQKKNTK